MPPPVVLINLDRDADRLAHMRAQLDRLGMAFERFPAVRGADLPDYLRGFFPREEDGSGFLSAGEIGCYASQLAVYQRIVERNEPTLVLEDDVALPDDLPALLDALLAALPQDWDMVRLSSTPKRAYVTLAELPGGRALVRYSISPGSNGAILVSPSGARKFLKPVPRVLPIDQDNRRLWTFDLNLFGVAPPPIGGNVLPDSSIDALAQGKTREERGRQAVLRAGRSREWGARQAWNMRTMGVPAWAASEALSVLISAAPRKQRPALLAKTGRWLGRFAKR